MNLLVGNRAMLDFSWHDEELALLQPDLAVTVLHPESPLDHQEQLVFVVMLVPWSSGDIIPNSTMEEFRVAEREASEQGRGMWGR